MTNATKLSKDRAVLPISGSSNGRMPRTPGAAAKALTNAAALAPAASNLDKSNVKPRLVRDSFTIPKSEYAVLEALKLRAANLARPSKKSEVLRAGIEALRAMSDKAFLAALERVPSLKTGRPKSINGSAPAK